MMAFDRGGAFLPKRTMGATGENRRWSHHRSWALNHLPIAEKMNGFREGAEWSQEEIFNCW
jgi:hypothetical protein